VEVINWKAPDHWLAALIIDNSDVVYGKVKDGFAILERIPSPESGFCFHDIVKVQGPIGTQKYKDDDIDEYKVQGLHKKSTFITFSFDAILPTWDTFFNLTELFNSQGYSVKATGTFDAVPTHWKGCYCTAESLEIAKALLSKFLKPNPKASIKDLKQFPRK
jgi:hypothetical protein